MYSLWLTTCADTRCPWVGRATSDLLLFIQAFGSCAASLARSLLLFIMWWQVTYFHISGQVGDCVYVHICARLPVCLLSLLAMVSCNLLYLSCILNTWSTFLYLPFQVFSIRIFMCSRSSSFEVGKTCTFCHKKARERKCILGFPPFNLFISTILFATLA